jgi:predicted nucleic acid-binding protein
MVTMAAKAFLDTNIVLRLVNGGLPESSAIEQLVQQIRDENYELWISRQVIREYLVQVTRPGFLAIPLSIEQVNAHTRTLRSLFKVADETDAVTDKLLELLNEFPSGGKQIHDVNIVATMLVHDIDTLLTLNVEDMKRFATQIKIRSPLRQ